MAYVSNLTPMELHQLPAATVYGGLIGVPLRVITLILSLLASLILIIDCVPKSLSALVAIRHSGRNSGCRSVLVHEQNAVLGRVKLATNLGAYGNQF